MKQIAWRQCQTLDNPEHPYFWQTSVGSHEYWVVWENGGWIVKDESGNRSVVFSSPAKAQEYVETIHLTTTQSVLG